MEEITDKQKHDYLLDWYWECEDHEAGFKVYTHNRFPNKKYKLNLAYKVMKANEPSLEPIATVSLDDDEAISKLKEALLPITNPKEHAVQELSKFLGTNLGSVRSAMDDPFSITIK